MLRFTRRPLGEKENKNIIIYDLLREKGEISRSDISALTNINVVSISNYINGFIKKGLIIEKQIGESSGGRPPILLDLNRDKVFAIGFSVSDSYMWGVMVDPDIKIINKIKKKIEAGNLEHCVVETINSLKKDKDNNFTKGIALILDFPAEANKSLARDIDVAKIEKRIKSEFRVDLYIDKPSISAAYAEVILNPDYQRKKLLYSHKDLGDCVLFEDSGFYTGEDENQSNLVYLRPWNSDMSITSYARRIIERGVGTEIIHLAGGSINNITSIEVIEAAKRNDNVAIEILEFVGLNLGVRLAYLANVFKPKKLVLGGDIEKAGKYFIQPLKKSIERLASEEVLRELEIVNTALGEEAVAIGAAALIIREAFMKV